MTIEKTNARWIDFEREIALADIRYDEEQRNFVHEYKEKCTLLALAGLSFAGFGGLTTLINMIARSDFDWKTH